MIDLEADPFDVDDLDEIAEAPAAATRKRGRAVMPRRKRAAIVRPPTGASCPHTTQSGADPRACSQCIGATVARVVAVDPIAGAAPIVASDLIDLEPKFPRPRADEPKRKPRATAGLERCPTAPVGRWTLGEVSALTGKSRASLRRSLARAGVEPVGKLRRQGPATLVFDRRAVEAWLASRPARGAADNGAQS